MAARKIRARCAPSENLCPGKLLKGRRSFCLTRPKPTEATSSTFGQPRPGLGSRSPRTGNNLSNEWKAWKCGQCKRVPAPCSRLPTLTESSAKGAFAGQCWAVGSQLPSVCWHLELLRHGRSQGFQDEPDNSPADSTIGRKAKQKSRARKLSKFRQGRAEHGLLRSLKLPGNLNRGSKTDTRVRTGHLWSEPPRNAPAAKRDIKCTQSHGLHCHRS